MMRTLNRNQHEKDKRQQLWDTIHWNNALYIFMNRHEVVLLLIAAHEERFVSAHALADHYGRASDVEYISGPHDTA
jgi:hypothetical protein